MSASSAMETPATFPYKPLDTEKSEIRNLKLPAKDSENLELITVSLDNDPKYAALSYLWGDPKDQEIITVQGQATNPRDYIYGLIGVTRVPILPDYRPEKLLLELYVEYVTGWLNAICGKKADPMKPLSFLTVAGVGLFGSFNVLPSWIPSLSENARLSIPRIFMLGPDGNNGHIPRNSMKDPYVVKDTQSLFVWGSNTGPIYTILEKLDCNRLHIFYSFLKSFLARHTYYVSGTPPLQALCQLLLAEKDSKAVSKKTVMLALCIASFALDFDTLDPEITEEFPWYHEWETRLCELALICKSLVSPGPQYKKSCH